MSEIDKIFSALTQIEDQLVDRDDYLGLDSKKRLVKLIIGKDTEIISQSEMLRDVSARLVKLKLKLNELGYDMEDE